MFGLFFGQNLMCESQNADSAAHMNVASHILYVSDMYHTLVVVVIVTFPLLLLKEEVVIVWIIS